MADVIANIYWFYGRCYCHLYLMLCYQSDVIDWWLVVMLPLLRIIGWCYCHVVMLLPLFYNLADVIAKDLADVIATVVVHCMLLLKALLCQWQMLLPLCFIWLMLLPMADVIARWLMLLPHLIFNVRWSM